MTMGEMEDDMEDIEMTMSDEEYLADLENKAMTANAKHYQHRPAWQWKKQTPRRRKKQKKNKTKTTTGNHRNKVVKSQEMKQGGRGGWSNWYWTQRHILEDILKRKKNIGANQEKEEAWYWKQRDILGYILKNKHLNQHKKDNAPRAKVTPGKKQNDSKTSMVNVMPRPSKKKQTDNNDKSYMVKVVPRPSKKKQTDKTSMVNMVPRPLVKVVPRPSEKKQNDNKTSLVDMEPRPSKKKQTDNNDKTSMAKVVPAVAEKKENENKTTVIPMVVPPPVHMKLKRMQLAAAQSKAKPTKPNKPSYSFN